MNCSRSHCTILDSQWQWCIRISNFQNPCQHACYCCLKNGLAVLTGVRCYLIVVLLCMSLMTLHLISRTCLLYILSGKAPVKNPSQSFMSVAFLVLSFESSLCILHIVFIGYVILKYFPQSLACRFIVLTVIFGRAKLGNFDQVPLIIVLLVSK